MKFRSTRKEDYFLVLTNGKSVSKDILFLRKGRYVYNVAFKNPHRQRIKLIIVLDDKDSNVSEISLESSEMLFNKELLLNKGSDDFNKPVSIHFSLQSGHSLYIQLPVSPLMVSSVITEDMSFKETVRKVTSIFLDKPIDTPESHASNYHSKSSANLDIFRDCLTWADAEKQLEYVVYYKSFSPDGSRGFLKWKRSFYRKLLISLYRSLTKNSIRKRYIAKIYRNYVNSNIIFENLERFK